MCKYKKKRVIAAFLNCPNAVLLRSAICDSRFPLLKTTDKRNYPPPLLKQYFNVSLSYTLSLVPSFCERSLLGSF